MLEFIFVILCCLFFEWKLICSLLSIVYRDYSICIAVGDTVVKSGGNLFLVIYLFKAHMHTPVYFIGKPTATCWYITWLVNLN